MIRKPPRAPARQQGSEFQSPCRLQGTNLQMRAVRTDCNAVGPRSWRAFAAPVNVTVNIVCINQKPITLFCMTRMCITRMCTTRIGNGSSWLPRSSGTWVGRCGRDNAEKTAFRSGMQSLCCLSGVQRSLPIALAQRLPGGLTHDVGVSCQQHQRGEVGAATRALRRSAKTSPADWTRGGAAKIVLHTRPSTKNSISRKS